MCLKTFEPHWETFLDVFFCFLEVFFGRFLFQFSSLFFFIPYFVDIKATIVFEDGSTQDFSHDDRTNYTIENGGGKIMILKGGKIMVKNDMAVGTASISANWGDYPVSASMTIHICVVERLVLQAQALRSRRLPPKAGGKQSEVVTATYLY